MNKGVILGLILVIVGVVIYALYALWLGAEHIKPVLLSPAGAIGALIVIGIIVIFVSVIVDRYHETEEIKEKISKEDLEP